MTASAPVSEDLDVFRSLGDAVSRRWEACAFDAALFPRIAQEALLENGDWRSIPLDRITDWIFGHCGVPQRLGFNAQPPVFVYRTDMMVMQLLFWIDAPTAIHQHQFAGAWGVVRGSSVHAEYTFDRHERVTPQLALGDLRFKRAEHLRAGDVRTIEQGGKFIHALLHLDAPSISLVIRTLHDLKYEPYNFITPGLAFDPQFEMEPLRTHLALLRTLYKADPRLYEREALRLIDSGDLWAAQRIVRQRLEAGGSGTEPSILSGLIAHIAPHHRELAAVLDSALSQRVRLRFVKDAMNAVREPDLRFFLALVSSAPDRPVALSLTADRFPKASPAAKLGELFEQIVRLRGIPFSSDRPGVLLELALQDMPLEIAVEQGAARAGSRNGEAFRRDWYILHMTEWLRPLLSGGRAAA